MDEDGNDVYDTVDGVMIEYNGNQRKSATLCTVTDDDYYCAGNPVNCVDPTGKDIYNVTSKGYIIQLYYLTFMMPSSLLGKAQRELLDGYFH